LLVFKQGGLMPQHNDPTRPPGDPLEEERHNVGKAAGKQVDSGKRDPQNLDRGHLDEPNAAQRQSDATNDVVGLVGVEEPTAGTTSDANGLPARDEAEGERRRRQYDAGADLVSKLD
jgi:hypothetical protein